MIEFLDVEPGDAQDEECLSEPPRREWVRRLWLPIVLVALLVVALVTINVTPGRTPKPTPSDTDQPVTVGRLVFLDPSQFPSSYVPFPSPSLAREVTTLRGVPGLPSVLLPGGLLPCPVRSACYLNRTMPAPVLAALRETFPNMQRARILTFEAQGSGEAPFVWFRQIHLENGTLDVTIQILPPARSGRGFSGTARYGTRWVNYTVVPNDPYAVIIHVEAPTGADVRLSVLSLLAIDRRLFTTSL